MRRATLRMSLATLRMITVAASLLVAGSAWADGRDALRSAPSIAAPTYADVRRLVLQWMDEQTFAASARKPIERLWPERIASDDTSQGLLDRVAASAAVADGRAEKLVSVCAQPRSGVTLPDVTWLSTSDVVPLVRNNLRLLYGRWLSQERLYDESLEQLKELNPADVVDPATLLFYQSVAHHRLLQKDAGLESLDELLNDVADVPQRYQAVGTLMQNDLEGLKDETLDHIVRRMDDVRRRLDLGRAGKTVRDIEDGVIESLDKMIEEMEKQQQQAQSAASAGMPTAPMQQPRLAPANGAGEVDHKRIGSSSGWGDLPPKQREEALQQISKDFPAHYRDVIEQYFRKLASESPQR